MAFGGPRSSCVRPGAHSARHQDSRNDWTPYRMAWPFVSAGAHAPHSGETPDPTLTRGSGVALRSSLTLPRFPVLLHRGFRIQETLRELCHSAQSTAQAESLPDRWYSWTRRCHLEPIKAVAKTLKKHWPSLLNAFDSRLTNGRVEAVNLLIQAAKAKARGYGTTRHLITIAYLVAGKLTQLPTSPFVVKSGLPITT